jgi:glycosyltransferase involved in cell wall biosynthesis
VRVLQFIETGGPGGAETVFVNLADGLRDRGHEVQCLVGEGNWLPDELRRRGLTTRILSTSGSFDVALLRGLVRQIRADRVDIVHAHLFDGAIYAALAAKIAGVPCVATLHGQVDLVRSGWRGVVKQQLFGRSVTCVVTVSVSLGRTVRSQLPTPAERFRVIPNGVARPEAVPVEPASRTESEQRASGPVRLVAIGNIRRPKDYPVLLDAVARVHHPRGVRLDVAGQPDSDGLFEALGRQAIALGIAKQITFHGFVADPTALLRQADCFVLSSSEEGFSLATIEAMLAGVPVVATRSGGPEEILRDGVTGLLVPIRNAEALASAIQRMLDDPVRAQQLAVAAAGDAADRYSLTTMVDSYLRLYEEILVTGRSVESL